MSDKNNPFHPAGTCLPNTRKKLLPRLIHLGMFAALGGGSAVAAPTLTHSVSRGLSKSAVVYRAEKPLQETRTSQQRGVFSSFGKSHSVQTTAKSRSEPRAEVLTFLEQNGLLEARAETTASLSGNTLGRKAFAHEGGWDHCHLTNGVFYFSSYSSVTPSACISWGGTWDGASNKPFVKGVTVSNKTTSSFDVGFKVNKTSTVYAVLVPISAVAPSSAQVVAGTDGSGVAAVQVKSVAATTTGTLSFSGLDPDKIYMVYLVARDSTPQLSPTPIQANPNFDTGLIDNVGTWKFPRVRTNSAGDFYLGHAFSNGIRFRKWNGTTFMDITTITPSSIGGAHGTGWGNENRVDYEVDANGHIYVIFSVYEGQMAVTGDPYFGHFNGTSWSFTKIAETGDGIDNVNFFIDPAGKYHLSFMTRNTGTNYLYYATNKSGSWVMTPITSAAGGMDEIHDTYVVADASSNATLVYRREDNQNNGDDNYYIAYSSNNFASPTILKNGKADGKNYRLAGLKIDTNGKLHYAYSDLNDGAAYYVTNASGAWVETSVSKGSRPTISLLTFERVGNINYFAGHDESASFLTSYDGEEWIDGFDFSTPGWLNDRIAISPVDDQVMVVSENQSDWSIHFHTGPLAAYITPPIAGTPNASPTDIALSNMSVNQSAGENAVVGTLSSTDVDLDNTFTYSLVEGAGDTDNSHFTIVGAALQAIDASTLTHGNHSVRIRTTDNAGGYFEKVFTIAVTDDVKPSITIGSDAASLKVGETANLTFTLSEASTTFTAEDVSVSGGTLSEFEGSGTSYSAVFTPTPGTTATATIAVAANVFTDAVGNTNLVAGPVSISADTQAPSVSISSNKTSLKAGETATLILTFSEPVTGFVEDDLTVMGGSITAFSGSGASYLATFSPSSDTAATATINIAQNVAVDIAGNGNSDADEFTIEVNTVLPTVSSIVRKSGGSAKTNATEVDFTVTFSEAVTGVGAQDFQLTTTSSVLGEIKSVTSAGAGAFTVTVGSISGDGTLRLDLKGGETGIRNAAGNGLTQAYTGGQTYTIDQTAPVVTSVAVPASGTYNFGTYLDFTLYFSENVNVITTDGVPAIPVTIGSSTVYATYHSAIDSAALNFRYTIQEGDDDNNGITLGSDIVLNGGLIRDEAGNAVNTALISGLNLEEILVDALPPDAPSAPVMTQGTNNITNVTTPTFTGTAEAGASITLYATDGITVLGSATATNGTWSITSSSLNEGTHSLTVVATDGAGNISSASNALVITIDTTPPSEPPAPVLAAESDTGVSNSDRITNLSDLTLFGAAGSAEAGATIQARSNIDGSLSTTTVNADGSWSLTVSGLSAGTHSLQVNATDVAGNASTYSNSLTVIIDQTAPALDGVSFDQTAVTVLNQSVISLTLDHAEVGSRASYSITSSGGGTAVTASNILITSMNQTLDDIDLSGLNDGTLTVNVTLQDTAGNTSQALTDSISKDAQSPEVTAVAISSGHYAEGDVISISVTLDEAVVVSGTQSRLALDIAGTTRYASFVSHNDGVLLYQYTVGANENTDGVGVIALANGISLNGDTMADAGGNPANLVYAQQANASAQVDTLAPLGPVLVTPAENIAVNADEFTFEGTHNENGVTVKLYLDADNDGLPDDNLELDSVVVLDGLWNLTTPLTSDTEHRFVVIAEDAAGNRSAPVITPLITEDSVRPAAPPAAKLNAESDTGASSTDGITSDTTPIFSGTAEAHSTIELTSDLDGVIGTAVTDSEGKWTITATSLSNGVHSITAIATDQAGNDSSLSTAASITIDTQAPTLTPLDDQHLSPGASTLALPITLADNLSAPTTLTLSALSSDLAVVATEGLVFGGNGADRTLTLSALGSGSTTITVTLQDLAGNTASESFTVVVNTAPIISGTPLSSVLQGSLYSFTPTASDINQSDQLTFSINTLPSWASFNPATGTLTGTPGNVDVGVINNIVISVSDGTATTSLPAFNLTVVNVNDAPTITSVPVTSATQDEAYSYTLAITDVDKGDSYTLNAVVLPDWLVFDPSLGLLSGTPTQADVGEHVITLEVTDADGLSAAQTFTILVADVNDAPVIAGTPSTSIEQDVAYHFAPTASDPDVADTLTFSILNKPQWASFDTATGVLSGTPSHEDVGMTSGIVISVSDGKLSASLPAFALEVVATSDPLQPVVTPPADIALDATALYTPVTLRQLLGLNPTATEAQIEAVLNSMASDGVSGNGCCTTRPEGLNPNNVLLLRPGRHEVVWTATSAVELTGSARQIVMVNPLVSLSKSQVNVRGNTVSFRVLLNGPAPEYPLDIPYVIDAATTATAAEHSLVNGTAHFTQAGQMEVVVPVSLANVSGFSDSQLVIALGEGVNAGAANRHVIDIRSGNVPPVVQLAVSQGGIQTSLVTANGGPVTVTASVYDANVEDTHSYDWSSTLGLADTDDNPVDAVRVIDPNGLTGTQPISVTVTDSAGASVLSTVYFRVVANLPVLSADQDSDGDGFSDLLEGTGDADDNGIPDYLDNMPSANILPQQGSTTDAFLIECDPGVRCGLGLFARSGTSGGVQVFEDELDTLGGLMADPAFTPVGGVFDFVIRDLPTLGQSVRIAIPQRTPIPANAVYRKYTQGQWVTFVEDADNALHSAPGNPGYCPPPGAAAWTPGLTEGHLCVQLTIKDGGVNDDDGLENGAVVDPGAVSAAVPENPQPEPEVPVEPKPPVAVKTSGGGATEGLWIIVLGGLLMFRSLGKRHGKAAAALALLVASFNSQAQTSEEPAGQTYVRVDLYRVEAGLSQDQFLQSLASAGHVVELDRYKVNRSGFQLALGYQWYDYTYTELGYLDLGDVKVDMTLAGDTNLAALAQDLKQTYPVSAKGITLVQGLTLFADQPLSASLEGGAYLWWDDRGSNQSSIHLSDDDGLAPLAGLRVDLALDKRLSLGLSARRIYQDDQVVDLYSFAGRYRF